MSFGFIIVSMYSSFPSLLKRVISSLIFGSCIFFHIFFSSFMFFSFSFLVCCCFCLFFGHLFVGLGLSMVFFAIVHGLFFDVCLFFVLVPVWWLCVSRLVVLCFEYLL